MLDSPHSFSGPIFVLGKARSGTKLLLAILNEHPLIAFPKRETEFLPYWVRTWPKYGNLAERPNFSRFYKQMMSLPYFYYLRKKEPPVIREETWFNQCIRFTPEGVFEALIKHDAGITNNENPKIIWGDKSPSYIHHLPMLARLFPGATFVHIVRDVRDVCLSLNRAWGINMLRAAQRWADDMAAIRDDAKALGDRYHEVKYEKLLENPRNEVAEICRMIGVDYTSSMLEFSQSLEDREDAKGRLGILQNNREKYRSYLNQETLHKIEAIAG